jgi:O-antigen/teichoic acid export membrane protein
MTEPPKEAPVPRRVLSDRRVAKDSAALALGSAANGLLAYVFFVLATRSLGAAAAAPLSVLWTYWAIAAAVLAFPLQHWVIRTVTADGHEGTVARSLRWIWAVTAGLALIAGVVSYEFREPLFRDDGAAFPLMVAAITAGACLSGLVRGGLSARGRFVATATLLGSENALRVILGAGIALAGGGAIAFGLVLVVGALTSLVWHRALRFSQEAADEPPVRSPTAIMSGLAGGSLIAQVVLTGPPVVLAAGGGSPAHVTSLFLALAVFRAPYLLALGMTPQLTHALTRFSVEGGDERLRGFRRGVVLVVLVTAVVAAACGSTLMAPLLEAVFGSDVHLPALAAALIGAGTAFALGNLVFLLLLLAVGLPKRATLCWLFALFAAGIWLLLPLTDLLVSVSAAFLVAEVTGFAGMVLATRRR